MSRLGWEESEFPILCETCLGPNPYVRMMKQNYGKECKICQRPFTIFRWSPGAGMRFKKTEICQTCAKIKNVCQTCVLDLEYGLPVQVRDTVLNNRDDAPTSDINKQYHVANMEDKLGNDSLVNYAKADSAARERLRAISRPEPYYKRNRQHICSFYVKGLCNRGAECPFRHELPVENELSNQNINDRYHGKEDPVAKKMLGKMGEHGAGLKAPADKSITTLYITGIDDTVSEQDLRNSFSVFGQLKKVVAVHKSHCAFVTFAQRSSAEQAVTAFPTMTIRDAELRIQWGRAKPQEETAT